MRHRVSVIASPGSGLAARAAKEATSTIPIVFGTSIDPVQQGLVASFNRPGANVTGINSMSAELAGKHLGLMHELLPRAARFGALVRADTATGYPLIKDLETAAAALERQIEIIAISTPQDIHAAFANGLKKRSEGLVVTTNPLFGTHRWLIAAMAARHGLPTIHPDRLFAEAGGLMSYGASIANLYRQVGIYTGRVLKGEKPADLPVMQEVRFEFVINLQVAKALDIDIPPALLARADEVIE
jgi:putative ABC transport system substrate-binding protein